MRLPALLLLIATLSSSALLAQHPRHEVTSASFSYSYTRANANAGQCGCFSLNGGSGELALPLGHGFTAIADLGGGTTPSVNGAARGLSLVTYTAGPRFSLPRHRFQPFVQTLAGGAHGFNSFFPTGLGASSANGFAMFAGGGLDVRLSSHASYRVAQADYLLTRLPNGSNNYQNNLRLSSGLVITFKAE